MLICCCVCVCKDTVLQEKIADRIQTELLREIVWPTATHTALGGKLIYIRTCVLPNDGASVNEYRCPVNVPVEHPVSGPSRGQLTTDRNVFPKNHILMGDVLYDGENEPHTVLLWPDDVLPLCDTLAIVVVALQGLTVKSSTMFWPPAERRLAGAVQRPPNEEERSTLLTFYIVKDESGNLRAIPSLPIGNGNFNPGGIVLHNFVVTTASGILVDCQGVTNVTIPVVVEAVAVEDDTPRRRKRRHHRQQSPSSS
jgi:hypothetical protein